jgi:hypothetical protein
VGNLRGTQNSERVETPHGRRRAVYKVSRQGKLRKSRSFFQGICNSAGATVQDSSRFQDLTVVARAKNRRSECHKSKHLCFPRTRRLRQGKAAREQGGKQQQHRRPGSQQHLPDKSPSPEIRTNSQRNHRKSRAMSSHSHQNCEKQTGSTREQGFYLVPWTLFRNSRTKAPRRQELRKRSKQLLWNWK